MSIWYNDNERFMGRWLYNLIAAGHLPDGVIDERSIKEIKAKDCAPTSHFFAGIGGWAYALQLAGWPEERPVWTGSCPCQPFSVAGRRGGTTDERHLWPEWFRLIKECRPPTIFGEQVASKDGYAWFDIVQADLESLGYACGLVVSPAAGYGAPHIRHRIYFVAESEGGRVGIRLQEERQTQFTGPSSISGLAGIMADASGQRRQQDPQGASGDEETDGRTGRDRDQQDSSHELAGYGPVDRLGDVIRRGGPVGGFWVDSQWLSCTDGKIRPTQPGLFPLAHGVPSRVGRLRAYGNAIVPPQAAEFIRAYMELAK